MSAENLVHRQQCGASLMGWVLSDGSGDYYGAPRVFTDRGEAERLARKWSSEATRNSEVSGAWAVGAAYSDGTFNFADC